MEDELTELILPLEVVDGTMVCPHCNEKDPCFNFPCKISDTYRFDNGKMRMIDSGNDPETDFSRGWCCECYGTVSFEDTDLLD